MALTKLTQVPKLVRVAERSILNDDITIVSGNPTPNYRDGALYFIEKEGELFYDTASSRVQITDLVIVDDSSENKTDIDNPVSKFYYFTDDHKLFIYKNGWNEIGGNSGSSAPVITDASELAFVAPASSIMTSTNVHDAIMELYGWIQKIESTVLFNVNVVPGADSTAFVANNPTIFGETITLSDSAANYDLFEVFGITNDNNRMLIRVPNPEGAQINLCESLMGYSSMIIKGKTYKVNGTTLTTSGRGNVNSGTRRSYAGEMFMPAAGIDGVQNSFVDENGIHLGHTKRDSSVFGIYRIVGYKYPAGYEI